MAQSNYNKELQKLLLQCMTQQTPMLSLLEWHCNQRMEAEVLGLTEAEKNTQSPNRKDYRCGYDAQRFDTRMGTIDLMVPKLQERVHTVFVTEHRRNKTVLIQVVQETFAQGV